MVNATRANRGPNRWSASADDSTLHLENHVGLPANFLERMARAAALAPSGDNLQPWSFGADGDTLLVRHDPQRDLSLFNVRYLASFIALGAALENITIAASTEGYVAKIDYFPDPHDDELTARVSFEPGASPDPLSAFLDKRCTNRRPYAARPIDPDVMSCLYNASEKISAIEIFWIQDKSKLKKLGQIVARADRLIFENPVIHSHLFSTIRWTQDEVEKTRDGLPIKSLELGHVGSLAFRCLKCWSFVNFVNRFGFSKATANHTLLLMRRCSAAGLITSPAMSPPAFIHVGRTFQRAWLLATKEQLAAQPMTAVIFLQLRSRLAEYNGLTQDQIQTVNELRRDLETFFALPADRVPAMLFRVGYAPGPTARTIRRSVTDKSEMTE
jgi:sulfur-carrier protein adenylyltransferase/sulfurtransferase